MQCEIRELNLFETICWSNGASGDEHFHWLGRVVEWYFDFGQSRFQVIQDECFDGICVEKVNEKRSWKSVVALITSIVFKLVTFATFVIPFIMFVGKCLYRADNIFVFYGEGDAKHPSCSKRSRAVYLNKMSLNPRKSLVASQNKSTFSQQEVRRYREILRQQAANERSQRRQLVEKHYSSDTIAARTDVIDTRIDNLKIVSIASLVNLVSLHNDILQQRVEAEKALGVNSREAIHIVKERYNGLLQKLSEKMQNDSKLKENYKHFQTHLQSRGLDTFTESDQGHYVAFTHVMQSLGVNEEGLYNHDFFEEVERKMKPIGMNNSFNRCYLNSILQVLMAVPFLRKVIAGNWKVWDITKEQDESDKDFEERRKADERQHRNGAIEIAYVKKKIQTFIRAYLSGSGNKVNQKAEAVRQALGIVEKLEGAITDQQDARRILSELLAPTGYSLKTREYISFTKEGEDVVYQAPLSYKEPILDVHMREAVGQDPHGLTLQELVDCQFRERRYDDLNYNLRGESIPSRTQVVKLEGVQDYLILNLKRFGNADNKYEIKYNDTISFPDGAVTDFTAAINGAVLGDGRAIEYEVVAFISHLGSPESGHYITHVKKGGMWYRCDDSRITKVGFANPSLGDGSLYVLKKK